MLEKPPVASEQEALHAFKSISADELKRVNADYPYWDKVKYMSVPSGVSNKDVWYALKWMRRLNRTMLKFGNYPFSFTITDEIHELLHYFDLHIGGALTETEEIPSENRQAYLISSIMEEAIASSQMEGAATTREVAKEMLRKKTKPKNKGQQMIVNNYRTINYIKEHSNEDFSIERLKNIHRLMTENTLEDGSDVGQFRDHDNILVLDAITGDIAHIPPPQEELEGLLGDLEMFFNHDGDRFIHPIIKAIIVHFMLSYIHPFTDGNGRTARSLFYWYMIKKGYRLIEFMPISRVIAKTKRRYEKAFLYTEQDENDLTYFILYHLRAMKKAYEELKLYLKRKTEENKSVALLASIKGINHRQAQIIQIVHGKPNSVFTVKEIENRFAVSNFTARADLEGLVTIGFLTALQSNKVKRTYVKSADFDTLIGKKV
jgi:Fic family protein